MSFSHTILRNKLAFLKVNKHTSCNSAETFLARSIPDLQLNPFAIQLDGPYLEVNTVL
jgi:hypothetical protein